MQMHRSRVSRVRRIVQVGALFVLIGTAVNVFVAWYGSLRNPINWTSSSATPVIWPGPVPGDWPRNGLEEGFQGTVLSGRRVFCAILNPPVIPSVSAGFPLKLQEHRWQFEVYESGWPWPCLSWQAQLEIEKIQTIITRTRTNTRETKVRHSWQTGFQPPSLLTDWVHPDRRLPTTLLWLGIIAGSLLYALFAYMSICGPALLRRAMRHHRGCCLQCGYNLVGSKAHVCSECGSPRRRR